MPPDIKLTSKEDWPNWFICIKLAAESLGVWAFANPDEHLISEKTMLKGPQVPSFESVIERIRVESEQRWHIQMAA